VSKLETLIEQTSFLLGKQEEAKRECADIFSEFISVIDKRTQSSHCAEDARSLEKIHDLITKQAKRFDEETQEDIAFLSEQLKMLEQVTTISDKEKAQEIMNMIVDEDEEILDTDTFKHNVLEEGALSKQNLLTMIEDIKEALNEGSVKEVELLLESFALEQNDLTEEDDEDSCECEECDEYENDKCLGCTKADDEQSDKKIDIFAEFNEYAERLEGKNKKNLNEK
jgi:hypothetical protein